MFAGEIVDAKVVLHRDKEEEEVSIQLQLTCFVKLEIKKKVGFFKCIRLRLGYLFYSHFYCLFIIILIPYT